MKLQTALMFAVLPLTVMSAQAQITPEASTVLQRPIEVERDDNVTTVGLIPHMGKFAIDATLNGVERKFVFDTGSPSMISRELANELDLEIIGSNTGRDANGREVTTDVAIVDQLAIGGTTFRSVPVLINDFGMVDPNECFFDGGVIGSEIFPGSAWHINAAQQTLQIAASIDDLTGDGAAQGAIAARLYDFGYPHAPVFDYAIGDFSDRGLFDTGNSDTIILFERVAQDARVKESIISGSSHEGYGSHGASAGGFGADTKLYRFKIQGMQLGEADLGQRAGTTRSAPPTLIGLGILATHDVTLDYPNERLVLHPRIQPEPAPMHPGYALMQSGNEVRVVQLFDDSPAQRAGLVLGDQVVAIDNRELASGERPCETTEWLVEARPTWSARELTVLREGQRVEIDLADR